MAERCPVEAWARKAPEELAIAFQGQAWSYAALDGQVAGLERGLRGRGLSRGDRVAVLSANRPELVALLYAVRRLGATLVPLNARLTPSELLPLLARVEPRLVIADEPLQGRLEAAVPLGQLSKPGPASPRGTAEPLGEDEPWAILFTSGTTGLAKGAELTVGNLEASARASAQVLGGGAAQRWLGALPLFHVGGLAMAVRCIAYGASLFLMPRFDATAARALMEAEGITHASFVAQTLAAVLDAPPGPTPAGDGQRPWTRLQAVLVGGGPAAPELLSRARQAGLPVRMTYGLTEAASQVCTERANGDGASSGLPLPGLELRIVDAARRAVGEGMEGEIEVRGPTVMRGYFRDPGSTRAAVPDGWLRTRDLGRLDRQGRLHVLARRSDLILSGGENVYPAELEAVLAEHPGVAEAAVVGVPDRTWGEVPVAFYRASGTASAGMLAAHCRARLAGYKQPRAFVALESLPRNAMGKVDRQTLKALAREATSSAASTVVP